MGALNQDFEGDVTAMFESSGYDVEEILAAKEVQVLRGQDIGNLE